MMYHSYLGAVWVLLAAAAALELYDEISPELNTELLYRDANDIDTEATRLNDLLRFALIRSRLQDGLRTSEDSNEMPTGDNHPMLTDASMLLQPQWRTEEATKKPRPGSNQVCYFKLCSIKRPGT